MTIVVAIDGPAASGKGTLAKRLANINGWAYLDTGALYRGVALKLLHEGYGADAAAGLPSDDLAAAARDLDMAVLADPRLRDDDVGALASRIAADPAVRATLLQRQRSFAVQPPGGEAGAVLDGRDIGTVICPTADAKLFVTARVDVRARRRHKDLLARHGVHAAPDLDAVLADLEARDTRDAARVAAPMVPAKDADLLDTTDLDIEAATQAVVASVSRQLQRR